MLTTILWTLLLAGPPAAKLPAETAQEMTNAIIAVNKALGLESWETKGEKPCVDRGGLEGTIKDISAEDTRQCASSAIAHGFPGLGKNYALGIPMAAIGPVTVFAIGIGEAEGWGGYSCDPKRRCHPTKLSLDSKPAKRLAERYRKACANAKTVWFPSRDLACTGTPTSAETAPNEPAKDGKPAQSPPRAVK